MLKAFKEGVRRNLPPEPKPRWSTLVVHACLMACLLPCLTAPDSAAALLKAIADAEGLEVLSTFLRFLFTVGHEIYTVQKALLSGPMAHYEYALQSEMFQCGYPGIPERHHNEACPGRYQERSFTVSLGAIGLVQVSIFAMLYPFFKSIVVELIRLAVKEDEKPEKVEKAD